ncbi:unnamed protein product [Amoebophrya sp. A25]|nr:unnamed protein product [Amoebophrya sp. A25]|eukprot:GSA25T00007910001.1
MSTGAASLSGLLSTSEDSAEMPNTKRGAQPSKRLENGAGKSVNAAMKSAKMKRGMKMKKAVAKASASLSMKKAANASSSSSTSIKTMKSAKTKPSAAKSSTTNKSAAAAASDDHQALIEQSLTPVSFEGSQELFGALSENEAHPGRQHDRRGG